MALDHVRDLMHVTSLTQDPTNLSTTTPILFFTRWITHLCAPTFVFLSGASVYISFKNQGNFAESRRFLLKRGIWLIILEFTIINFAIWSDIQFRILISQVIAAIGFGLIMLALLQKIPSRTIGGIGLVIIFGHNLLQGISFNHPALTFLWSLFFSPNVFPITPQFTFFVAYPFVPWLGIMLVGFASGELFELSVVKRKKILLQIGMVLLTIFALIRFTNLYGDPSQWSTQKNTIFTFLSFINTTKYPPSLLYSLMTLGIMFLILSFADGIKSKFIEIVSVYGKVPLFYYLIHWYIIHSLMFVMVFLQGFLWADLPFGPFSFGRPPTGSGVELWLVYLIWLSVVVFLYRLCQWYGHYKASHRTNKWLRYL